MKWPGTWTLVVNSEVAEASWVSRQTTEKVYRNGVQDAQAMCS